MSIRAGDFDIREIFRILARRKLVVAIPAVVTVAAGLLGALLSEPQYQSSAMLAREDRAGLTRAVTEAANPRGRHNDQVRLMRKRIRSSGFLESVAVQIGLHENPRLVARAKAKARQNPDVEEGDLLLRECVGILQRAVDVRAEGSNVFYIRAVSSNPRFAYQVASTVAEQYLESTREGRLQQSEEAHKFSLEQMAIYEQRLEEKRGELREFEQRIALKPLSSSPVTGANVSRVNSVVAATDADLEFLNGRHQIVRTQIGEAGLDAFLDLGLVTSPRLQALRETLLELERHLALTLVEYEDGSPASSSAKTQIAVKSQQLLAELEQLVARAFPSLVEEYRQLLVDYEYTRISLDATGARKRALEQFLERYASDLASMPANEFRLARLQEEVASAQRLYETWLEQANSTQIAKAVQAADVGNPILLLEEAKLPLAPFAPDRRKILFVTFALGIALGVGAAVAAEYFDATLRSVDEIEALVGAPVLGAVPRMQSAVVADLESRRVLRVRGLLVSSVLAALAVAAVAWWFLVANRGGV